MTRFGHTRRLPQQVGRDIARCFSAALVACAVASLVEMLITGALAMHAWSAADQPVAYPTLLRLLCLDLALWAVAWPIVGAAVSALAVLVRLWMRVFSGDAAYTWPGLLAHGPNRERGATRLAAWLWALSVGAAVYVPLSARLTVAVGRAFNAPAIEAVLLGALQLVLIGVVSALTYAVYRGVYALGRAQAGRLGLLNPAGRPAMALAVLCGLGLVSIRLLMAMRPDLAPLVPFRHLVAGVALLFGLWLATAIRGAKGGLLPAQPKARLATLFGLLFAAAILVPVSLVRVGAEAHAKFVATAHSPPLASLMGLVRAANDFDGDGYGSLLGENDCAPFDAAIRPGTRDVPDNGIDENCDGRDFSLASLPALEKGEVAPVPEEFRKPWNVLLVTIDTVRYDHTSFGGYPEKTGRDTTPRLAELVQRSVSFEFANAPSAGTMASIPAILTSKFFHSGIALGPDRKGMPPILKESNLLLAEIMKSAGYTTGALLSHYYFNDWGMEQGFDTYDNEVGKVNEPFKVTSHELTDKALEWIARRHQEKWFLWVHYIDPHGRYVAHPGETSWGDSEEDLYDGELRYTDKHVGRLLDGLGEIPGADRTIVVITSDHGDGFNEHGFINHGMALYRELLHVPLIFYVPGAQPRVVKGAVSPLDIVPTLAQLAGAEVSSSQFEGVSLVPQIFYGKDEPERMVFAETNWPKPLRAAITERYKLILDLKANVHQLYDLKKDPWEKSNVWQRDKAGKKLARSLDDWLERVFYARDFEANQVTQGELDGILLSSDPKPGTTTELSFDRGAIEVVGVDLPTGELGRGQTLEVPVYFRVGKRAPSGDFKIGLEIWDDQERVSRGAEITPAGGVFPTSRWRPGDRVRVPVSIKVPAPIHGPLRLGLRMKGSSLSRGPSLGDSEVGELGPLPVPVELIEPRPSSPTGEGPARKKPEPAPKKRPKPRK